MKIIDEEKVKNEISKIEKVVNGKLSTAFEKGVEFAESELQNLAIEFAEWIDINGIRDNEHNWKYKFDNYVKKFTSIEMFEKFIEQRKKAQ